MLARKQVLKVVALSVSIQAGMSQTGAVRDEALKHLPPGSELASLPGQPEPTAAAAIGSITGPGNHDIALVYEQAGGLFLRVAKVGSAGSEIDARLPGAFVADLGSSPGLLLRDAVGLGKQQVFVVSSEGASAGSNGCPPLRPQPHRKRHGRSD